MFVRLEGGGWEYQGGPGRLYSISDHITYPNGAGVGLALLLIRGPCMYTGLVLGTPPGPRTL